MAGLPVGGGAVVGAGVAAVAVAVGAALEGAPDAGGEATFLVGGKAEADGGTLAVGGTALGDPTGIDGGSGEALADVTPPCFTGSGAPVTEGGASLPGGTLERASRKPAPPAQSATTAPIASATRPRRAGAGRTAVTATTGPSGAAAAAAAEASGAPPSMRAGAALRVAASWRAVRPCGPPSATVETGA